MGKAQKTTPLLTGKRKACAGHDLCVWYNCDNDALVPDARRVIMNGASATRHDLRNFGALGVALSLLYPRSTQEDIYHHGDTVCGYAALQTKDAFGIGFWYSWCPPCTEPGWMFGQTCYARSGKAIASVEMGTSHQRDREARFWSANPQLVTWC